MSGSGCHVCTAVTGELTQSAPIRLQFSQTDTYRSNACDTDFLLGAWGWHQAFYQKPLCAVQTMQHAQAVGGLVLQNQESSRSYLRSSQDPQTARDSCKYNITYNPVEMHVFMMICAVKLITKHAQAAC